MKLKYRVGDKVKFREEDIFAFIDIIDDNDKTGTPYHICWQENGRNLYTWASKFSLELVEPVVQLQETTFGELQEGDTFVLKSKVFLKIGYNHAVDSSGHSEVFFRQ